MLRQFPPHLSREGTQDITLVCSSILYSYATLFENPVPGSVANLRGPLAVEFKGPNALGFCRNGVPTEDCDAWEYVTAQAREYAIDDHFQHIVMMDIVYGIYLP